MEKLGFGICPKVQASNHCHFHGSEGQKTIHWWKACRVAMTPGNPFSSEVWASLAGSCSIRYNSYAQAQRPVPPGTVKRISVFTRTFYVFHLSPEWSLSYLMPWLDDFFLSPLFMTPARLSEAIFVNHAGDRLPLSREAQDSQLLP